MPLPTVEARPSDSKEGGQGLGGTHRLTPELAYLGGGHSGIPHIGDCGLDRGYEWFPSSNGAYILGKAQQQSTQAAQRAACYEPTTQCLTGLALSWL